MRLSRLFVFAISSLLIAGATAVIAQPMAMPGRRGGQWELSMSGMGPQGGAMTMTICVDPAAERSFSPGAVGRGPGPDGPRCTKEEHHPIPGGWAFSSECPGRRGVVIASGTVTGDFRTHLHMDMDVKEAGADHHMVTDQRWIAPVCAAGGRTMTLPDGRVISIPSY